MSTERWRALPRAVHTRTPSGGVVLDPVAKAYFTLNPSGEALWRSLQRGASRPELVEALVDEFEVDAPTAEKDVDAWLRELEAARLIERIADEG